MKRNKELVNFRPVISYECFPCLKVFQYPEAAEKVGTE